MGRRRAAGPPAAVAAGGGAVEGDGERRRRRTARVRMSSTPVHFLIGGEHWLLGTRRRSSSDKWAPLFFPNREKKMGAVLQKRNRLSGNFTGFRENR